jgi:uncharacterized protein
MPANGTHDERVSRFLQFGCWDHREHGAGDHLMYAHAAARLVAQHPEIARDSLYTAVVAGDVEHVAQLLDRRPEAAREAGGARQWTPLQYVCYARLPHQPTIDNAVTIARMLLDGGGNPNDAYLAGSASYTLLVGAAADGEQDCPRQPQSEALFALLLERGAEPFDIQVLYNTHFRGDILWWLKLVYEHSMRTGRAGAWQHPDWPMLDMGGYGSGARFVFWTALTGRNPDLMRWALEHGASPDPGPARASSLPRGSMYSAAVMFGELEMAELLAAHGARRVLEFNAREAFMAACFALDRQQAGAYLDRHPDERRATDVLFAAAERDRADVVELLLELGVPIDVEDDNQARVTHAAAGANALRVMRLLLERDADVDARERRHPTPMGRALLASGDDRSPRPAQPRRLVSVLHRPCGAVG